MKVLINFSTLKAGGGQNVAMNFLLSYKNCHLKNVDFYFFVAKGSAPHTYLESKGENNFYVVPNNPILRIVFEIFLSKSILKKQAIDIIYSYFGVGVFTKKIPQVTGSADSNLYFPEINFWSGYSGVALIKRRLVDWYRIWGVKYCTAVIFENKILEKRGKELHGLEVTSFIKPSINFNLTALTYTLPIELNESIPKGLFLCGWQLNKNIMLIPELAYELKRRNIPFHFLLTAPEDNSHQHREFKFLVHKYNVEDMITILGQVKKDELSSLYNQIDFVFLLSKLESFSNNIIEAWYFKKILFVSNELWAQSICEDAAVYVDRASVLDIVNNIEQLIKNKDYKNRLINKGVKILQNYPSIETRIKNEVGYLDYVYKNY